MIPRAFMPTPCWGFARTAKTSTYAVTAVDRGYTIDCTSGTFSVTLAAAATLGAGFSFAVYNSGAGVITIDPNGSETIRGPEGSATTLTLAQGNGVLVQCDGTGFEVVGNSGLCVSVTLAQTISGAKTFSGITAVSNTTAATTTSDGAFRVSGGISSLKSVICDGFYSIGVAASVCGIRAPTASISQLDFYDTGGAGFAWYRNGGGNDIALFSTGFGGNVLSFTYATGVMLDSCTVDATSTGTGSMVLSGGLGVAKRICLDGATGKTLRITNGVANAAVAVTFTGVGPTGSTAGPPQGWMRIDINGTDRYIPYW